MTKVEIDGMTYCVETLIYAVERLTKDVKASAEYHRLVLDNIKAEIEELPKTYPFVNHIDTYVKEDDVKKILDKYKTEWSDKE